MTKTNTPHLPSQLFSRAFPMVVGFPPGRGGFPFVELQCIYYPGRTVFECMRASVVVLCWFVRGGPGLAVAFLHL